jgi:hypothetical protein
MTITCAVPGCGHPDGVVGGSEYCPVHASLVYEFTGWLYGWAVRHFDADRIALGCGGRRLV